MAAASVNTTDLGGGTGATVREWNFADMYHYGGHSLRLVSVTATNAASGAAVVVKVAHGWDTINGFGDSAARRTVAVYDAVSGEPLAVSQATHVKDTPSDGGEAQLVWRDEPLRKDDDDGDNDKAPPGASSSDARRDMAMCTPFAAVVTRLVAVACTLDEAVARAAAHVAVPPDAVAVVLQREDAAEVPACEQTGEGWRLASEWLASPEASDVLAPDADARLSALPKRPFQRLYS